MTKKRLYLYVVLCGICSALLFVCGIFGLQSALAAGNNEVLFNHEEIKEQYYYGEILEIPTGKFVVNGTEYMATHETVYPNGSRNTADAIELDVCGNYKIQYMVRAGGQALQENVLFTVTRPLYETTGKGSVEYGCHEYLNGQTGLITSLGLGETFQYNNVIDLNTLDRTKPLITFNITPETIGVREFNIFKVKVEDIYDPTNYFVIDVHAVDDGIYGDYVGYGGVSVFDTGLTYNQSKDAATASSQFGTYGLSMLLSFNGTPGVSLGYGCVHDIAGWDAETETFSAFENGALTFYYDNEENEVWFKSANEYNRLLDLDSVGKNWKGFTDGKVKLSLWTEKLAGTTANFVIYDIAGHDLSQNVLDNGAPIVTIDAEQVPQGLINTPYPIFNYKIVDMYGGETIDRTFVYYNYYGSNRASVSIQDGAFLPKHAGVYTIVYTSESIFSGMITTKTIDVVIVESVEDIEITLTDKTMEGITGSLIKLAEAVLSGGVGDLSVDVSVIKEGKEYVIEDGCFRPSEEGVYTVTYFVTDFIGRTERNSYTIDVDYSAKAFFLTKNIQNKFLSTYMVGYGYKIPEIEAAYYNEQGELISLDVTIVSNNGTIENGIYTATTAGNVLFTVSAGNGANIVSEEVSVWASDAGVQGSLSTKNLFVGDAIMGWQDNYVLATFESDGKICFANALLSDLFRLTFNVTKTATNVGTLRILLEDSENKEQSIAIDIHKKKNEAYMQINGSGFSSLLEADFSGNESKDFLIKMSGSTVSVGTISLIAGEYLNGKPFNGFDSHKVFMSIEASTVTGTSGLGLIIKEVCGQIMNNSVNDSIGPQFVLLGDYGGLKELGSVVQLPQVFAGDVLSPGLKSFTVTVARINAVVSTNGITLQEVEAKPYELQLNEYGTYRVTYTAVDLNGISSSMYFLLRVLDFTAPELTLKAGYTTTGKVGQAIKIAEFEATDNADDVSNLSVRVYWKDSKGYYHDVEDGKVISAEVGEISVFYCVFDTNGNTATVGYTITIR